MFGAAANEGQNANNWQCRFFAGQFVRLGEKNAVWLLRQILSLHSVVCQVHDLQ